MPTEEQLQKIGEMVTEAERLNENFRKEVRLADKAGADVAAAMTKYDERKVRIARIKRAYGV